MTGGLGRGARLLTGFPQALPVFPDRVERRAMLVAELPRFLG
jgi:hypothetical protein